MNMDLRCEYEIRTDINVYSILYIKCWTYFKNEKKITDE